MSKKQKNATIVVAVVLLVLLVIGLAYAAFTYAQKGNKTNTITTGVISMSYETEEENGISLTNAMPMSDEVGKAQTADNAVFDFTVSINTTGGAVTYEVTAEKTAGDLEYEDVKLYLTKSTSSSGTYTAVAEPSLYTAIGKTDELGATSGEMRLDSGVVTAQTTYYYKLRMWVASDYEVGDTAKSFTVKVNVYGKNGNITLTSGRTGVASEVITSLLATNSETMMEDGTTDNNIRYTGANPDNYVTFNEETAGWRIVGVFGNNIKLVRKESIGNWSWDSSESTVNSGNGVNDWTKADLKETLNSGAYWSRDENGTCYNGQNDATTLCNFGSIGLTSDAQNMISSTTWYLGGATSSNDATVGGEDKIASQWYSLERGSNVYNCSTNDGACPRPTTWTGKVGLLYPSDYGYASSSCNSSKVLTPNSGSDDYRNSICTGSNWLYLGSNEWLLSPFSSNAYFTWRVHFDGHILYGGVSIVYAVRPAVYLDSNVKITGGDGSSGNPYRLSL